ncbi:MAG: hypothetical protein WBC51_16530 [Vicinamibacterales bacterium]
MRTQPESGNWAGSHAVIRRVRRRLLAAAVLESVSLGLALAGAIAAIGRSFGWSPIVVAASGVAATVSAAAVWFLRGRPGRSLRAAADAVERCTPSCQNVVVTAVELSDYPDRAQPWVRQRVFADADALLAHVDVRPVVRIRRPIVLCAGMVTLATTIALGVHERAAQIVRSAVERGSRGTSVTASNLIAVTLEPPAYTGQPVKRLSNPDRIEAVEGTRLRIEIDASTPTSSVRFGSAPLRTSAASGVVSAELSLRESGYLAVQSRQRLTLIPVTVSPDRPPAIRIEQPGRDLLLIEAKSVVDVGASVTDDFGVAGFTLRYTRVSGSGEQFEFQEGELPLTVVKRDRLAWQGRGAFQLSALGLQPGDSLVYRFVARDGRASGSGTSTSDTFFIEIAGPGQVALEGVAMPPDRERYALSQQMIVLKIERLREHEGRLSRDALQEQGADIAAEQRAVKSNFVFLMGGHVEDEEVEAEQSSDIQEGRLQNTGRREIVRAIDHMTRTERALATIDTASALGQAKLAVEALQRAFGRNRYILRMLPARDRIDPSRRLTGKLEGARSSSRSGAVPETDGKADRIRGLFTSAMTVTDDLEAGRAVETQLSRLSERALAIDPADPTWQGIARQLGTVRDSLAGGDSRARSLQQLRAVLGPIAGEAQRVALPSSLIPVRRSTLRGAWADELAGVERRRR